MIDAAKDVDHSVKSGGKVVIDNYDIAVGNNYCSLK